MKFSYLMIGILIIFGGFQYLRVNEIGVYSSLKQTYNFSDYIEEDGEIEIVNPQNHLVVYRKDKSTEQTFYNLEEFLKFAKVDYEVKGIEEDLEELEKYSSIVILTEIYSGFKKENFIKIKEYTEKGGNLIFLGTPPFNPFNKIIGIVDSSGYIDTEGIWFKQKFFPGLDSVRPSKDMMTGSSLDVELEKNIKIIATDDYETPIIWENSLGTGKTLSVNTTLLETKIFRGLLGQVVSYNNDYFIMPVFNSKLVHIDDFPAPIPYGTNQIIKTDYHMKTRDFFKKVWWKDMESISFRQKLKFTGYMIGEYNDVVNKDRMMEFSDANKKDLLILGRELLELEGELGVHGYNHLSLALKGGMLFEEYGYKPWTSEDDMVQGLKKVSKVIEDIYGDNLNVYSYVPPSNVLSTEGKLAVIKALPNLKTISGLYSGVKEKSKLLQDVGRDPDYPSIYSMPRFSFGFFYTEDIMWMIYNGIATYGLVSHFIHPDDIIDEERGKGKSWEVLRNNFEKIFSDINEKFPSLDPSVQSMSTKRYITMEAAKIHHEMIEDEIKINVENYRGEINSFVRIRGKEIKKVEGGEYRIIDSAPTYNIYLVRIQNKESKILLKDS